mgnify:CR=1 FL=1
MAWSVPEARKIINQWHSKYKIDFVFNKKFPINSLKLMRGLLIVKDEIKNEEDERRFIDLIKNKDKAIKLITEKYG